MNGLGPEYRDMMRDLHHAYQAELPGKGRDLEAAADALMAGWSAERREALFFLAHRLAGSSAIYGFEEVSAAAKALEAFLVSAREGAEPAPGEREAQLSALVRRVAEASRGR